MEEIEQYLKDNGIKYEFVIQDPGKQIEVENRRCGVRSVEIWFPSPDRNPVASVTDWDIPEQGLNKTGIKSLEQFQTWLEEVN